MRLVLRPLRTLRQELAHVSTAPFPIWLQRFYEVHSFAYPDRPTAEAATVSMRLAAAAEEIAHRLSTAADLVRMLETSGWQVTVDGDRVIAEADTDPASGWAQLELDGISGHLGLLLDRGSDLRPPRPPAPGRDRPGDTDPLPSPGAG